MRTPILSKSKFLSALQCPLLLWTQYRAKDTIPPPDAAQEQIFATGHRVGELAKRLYPDGVEIDFDPTGGGGPTIEDTAEETQELMAERRPLFEASFLVDEPLAGPAGARYLRADILVPVDDDAWDLIEVKSGTRVKDVNVWDVAFQAETLERAGVKLRRLCLMHLNRDYVRDGHIDPRSYFRCADITEQARERMPGVAPRVTQALRAIAGPQPQMPIGPQCHDPFTCAMLDVCWAGLPAHHVTELVGAGAKAFAWRDAGHELVADVPPNELSMRQRLQQQAVRDGQPIVDRAAVARALAGLTYPLWHLDFESANPAIPLFDGTRPYQHIPFQFSLHVQDAPGSAPRHVGFLWTEPTDPRPALLHALEAIGPNGSVVAFNASFEAGVLRALGEAFPHQRARTDDLVARLVDLADPFRRWELYHPDQHGSYSLKAVLPAFTGGGYEGLAIADGQTAGREWLRVVHDEAGAVDPTDRARTLDDLRAYCATDTRAMVELLERMTALAVT